VQNILADGIVFRKDRKRVGFQIVAGEQVIWDFPREFADTPDPTGDGRTYGDTRYHNWYLRDLYDFLKLYMATPRSELDQIKADFAGLRDVLLASDKRLGRHSGAILMFATNSRKAREIIYFRFGSKRGEA
jgi:hypothetical protein